MSTRMRERSAEFLLPLVGLLAQVQQSGTCLLWTGRLTQNGVPLINKDGHHVSARVVAWFSCYGISPKVFVRVTCGERRCVNPNHLTAYEKPSDAFERYLCAAPTEKNCWEWQGYFNSSGYGTFVYRGKDIRAHRFAYEYYFGDVGELCVLHKCDNPPCVNPGHLFVGTPADNNADKMAKGRHASPVGAAHPNAKLTRTDVEKMREEFDRRRPRDGLNLIRKFAQTYGISISVARQVAYRQSWKSVED